MASRNWIGSRLVASALLLVTCSAGSHQTDFNPSAWRAAGPVERRKMAEEFLKKYDPRGSTIRETKELLGEPNYEHDLWSYDISIRGSRPTDVVRNIKVFEDLELLISFREGIVSEVGLNHNLNLDEDLSFDSAQWRVATSAERMKMAGNLISTRILRNKSKRDVEKLLGDANRKSEYIEMGYDLGLRVIDHIYLVFLVSFDGKILDAKIEEH